MQEYPAGQGEQVRTLSSECSPTGQAFGPNPSQEYPAGQSWQNLSPSIEYWPATQAVLPLHGCALHLTFAGQGLHLKVVGVGL